jgi:hypothetical protein
MQTLCMMHAVLAAPVSVGQVPGTSHAIARHMKSNTRTEYVNRDAILKLLSDEEIARVSTAETALNLIDGDEYVDLEEPERGVRKALGTGTAPMGHLLPRKAVAEKAWQEIVALLLTLRTKGTHPTVN